LITHDPIVVPAEGIDDLSLALIAPLPTDDDAILQWSLPSFTVSAKAGSHRANFLAKKSLAT
jgi:hypothetical protein